LRHGLSFLEVNLWQYNVALANLCQLSDAFKRGVKCSGTISLLGCGNGFRKCSKNSLSSNTFDLKTNLQELVMLLLDQPSKYLIDTPKYPILSNLVS